MKKIYYTTIVLVTIVMIACTSPSQRVEKAKIELKDAKQELHQAQQDSVTDFESFQKESEERIRKNEIAIDAYKARIILSKWQLKEQDQKKIDELERKNIDMRNTIVDYKENGRDEWRLFREKFLLELDELCDAVKNTTA